MRLSRFYLVHRMTIRINNSDRVLILGTTGSGKTVLSKYLLADQSRLIVIDPKHTYKADRLNKNRMKYPAFTKNFRLLVRPGRADDERLADFLLTAFKKKDVTIYNDELAVMEERYPATVSILKEIALTGREKRVSLWNATQRPRFIQTLFKTESEVWFTFRLQSEEDRKHVAGYIGNEAESPIPLHQFWYYRTGEESPRLMRLDMQKNRIYAIESINTERSLSNV